MEKIVIALGGNALQEGNGAATAESQLEVVKKTSQHIADIIDAGYNVIIAHGNGPQVGRIVLQNEYASSITPAMPFDVCGAMSQGMIGYHIQQALKTVLKERNINRDVVTVVTQVVVDKNDPAFLHPTKPIGPFYTKEEAEKSRRKRATHLLRIPVADTGALSLRPILLKSLSLMRLTAWLKTAL